MSTTTDPTHSVGAPPGDRLRAVAARLVWWLPPEESLQDVARLVAQAMAIGTWDDVQVVRASFGDAAFVSVLRRPPAGVFDHASWSYWHHRLGVLPVPPLPVRFPT